MEYIYSVNPTYLPHYWEQLKALQSKTNRPFRRATQKTIFDLEIEFESKKRKNNETAILFHEAKLQRVLHG